SPCVSGCLTGDSGISSGYWSHGTTTSWSCAAATVPWHASPPGTWRPAGSCRDSRPDAAARRIPRDPERPARGETRQEVGDRVMQETVAAAIAHLARTDPAAARTAE